MEFTEKPDIPVVSFASQPKQYVPENSDAAEDNDGRTEMDNDLDEPVVKEMENGALDNQEQNPDYDQEHPFL